MDLDQLTGEPAATIPIGGRPYLFSELPLGALGALQAWVRKAHPHPVEAVKPFLAGLPPEDRAELLDRARRDALHWPPVVGTAAGTVALLSTQAGQEECLHQALRVHQPGTTRAEAGRLFRQLVKDAHAHAQAEGARARLAAAEGSEFEGITFDRVTRIFAVAFGMDDPDDGDAGEGGGGPKAG